MWKTLMQSLKQSSSIGNVSFPFPLGNFPEMAGWPSAPRHTLFSSSLYCPGAPLLGLYLQPGKEEGWRGVRVRLQVTFLPQQSSFLMSEPLAAVRSSSQLCSKTELPKAGTWGSLEGPSASFKHARRKKWLLINPFPCSNHESLLFLVNKETFPKSGFSPDGRRWEQESNKASLFEIIILSLRHLPTLQNSSCGLP